MKDGAVARGVVVQELPKGLHGTFVDKVRIRVHFDDGTTSEITRVVKESSLGVGVILIASSELPMRYDPQDRSRIEIDIAASRREHAAEAQALQESNVRYAEARLTPAPVAQPARPSASIRSSYGGDDVDPNDQRLDALKQQYRAGSMTFDQVKSEIKRLAAAEADAALREFLDAP